MTDLRNVNRNFLTDRFSWFRLADVCHLDLHVDRGEVVALLGANDAGETTTLLTIAGVLPAAGGQIRFLDERIERWPAPRVARHGAVLVRDDRCLFPKLTVRANLVLSAPRKGSEGDPLVLFPELRARLTTPRDCSPVASSRCSPSPGAPAITEAAARGRAQLRAGAGDRPAPRAGAAQRGRRDGRRGAPAGAARPLRPALAERVYVLSHGTPALAAPAAELRDNLSLLQASYLGEGNGSVATTDRRSP